MKWRSLQESGSYRDMRPLREIFAERKDAIAKYVPPDVQIVHARAVAELSAKGIAAATLGVLEERGQSVRRSNSQITTANLFHPLIFCPKAGWCSCSYAAAGVPSVSDRWRR